MIERPREDGRLKDLSSFVLNEIPRNPIHLQCMG
jgi:hypothetical protein